MPRSLDYLGAVGIGVSDLKKSADFYERVLGMTPVQTYKLDYMDEIVLTHESRTAVVLMHWTDGSVREYKNNPIKLVFYFTDPKAIAKAIKDYGCEVTREPAPVPTLRNAMVGLAKDPDGYVIELLQAPPAKTDTPKEARASA